MTIPFELQEARRLHRRRADRRSTTSRRRSRSATRRRSPSVERALAELAGYRARRQRGRRRSSRSRRSRRLTSEASERARRDLPGGVEGVDATRPTSTWSRSALDQMEAAVSRRRVRAGRAGAADAPTRSSSSAPRSSCGRSTRPGRRDRGAGLVRRARRRRARRADRRRAPIRARSARPGSSLDEALDEARAKTGEGASDATVITNAALIVFREGLEAILIIAAITASMVGAQPPPAAADLPRRPARAAGQRRCLFVAAARARLALAVRREARGDRRPGRDRGPAAGPELVLPPRLLDRVDRRPPQAREGAARGGRGGGRRRGGDGRRPLPARLLERLPRGLRDGPLPAGAAAQLRDRDRRSPASALGLVADGGGRRRSPSRSSAGCPTSGC